MAMYGAYDDIDSEKYKTLFSSTPQMKLPIPPPLIDWTQFNIRVVASLGNVSSDIFALRRFR